MKNKKLLLGIFILSLLFSFNIQAQEDQAPVFITVTTMHRNLDADRTDWRKTEQEYFDKVTSKNDLIIGSEILNHYYTANSSEILHVSVYKTWGDIEKSGDVTNKLIEKAWPNEKERKAFLEKYNSYYSPMHSDEIYSSAGQSKELKTTSKEPMIVYVRKSQMASKDLGKETQEFNEKIIMNNPYIKAYYPHRHAWGSDNRDFLEAFMYDSMCDLEKSSDSEEELIKTAWPNEENRKAFFDKLKKDFTGVHGDYIYVNEPSLSK